MAEGSATVIDQFPFCDPARRHDFVMFFDVRAGNPNGDPDAGNLPRMDPSTRLGMVTDVCTKRKIRDYLQANHNRPIFIQSESSLNALYGRAARELADHGDEDVRMAYAEVVIDANSVRSMLAVKPKKGEQPSAVPDEHVADAINWIRQLAVEGFDVETDETTEGSLRAVYFGEAKSKEDFKKLFDAATEGVDGTPGWAARLHAALGKALAEGKGDLTKAAREKVRREMERRYDDIRLFGAVLTFGTNAGQVRGPLQITFGRSVEPILPQEAAITRCAITRESDRARKQTEFGRKSWLGYAIYRQHGHFSPAFAKQTGVTDVDLLRFWVALCKCHDAHRTASSGEQRMQELIVFSHDSARGNAPSHKLLDPIQVRRIANAEPTGVYDLDFETVFRRGRDEKDVKPLDVGDAQQWPKGVSAYRPLEHLEGMESMLEMIEAPSTGA